MAITFTNGNGTNVWNDAGNWDAAVPTSVDDVIFDGTSTDACTCDVAIDVLSLTVAAAYNAAKFDFGDNTYAHAIGTGGALFAGGNEVDCGDATITCDGSFNNKDQTTWTRDASTVVLTGTGKSITGHLSKDFFNLTFLNGSSITVSSSTSTRIDVQGTLTIDGTVTLDKRLSVVVDGDMVIGANADISGVADLFFLLSNATHGLTSVHASATISCKVQFRASVAGTRCVPFTTSGVFQLEAVGAENTLLQLDALGDYVFGEICFDNDGTGLVTLDNATNGPASITCGDLTCDMAGTGHILVDGTDKGTDWTITGDVIQIEGSSGRLTWTPGTGDMTFSGTVAQAIDFNGQTVEAITIDNASGTVTFGDAVTTAAFTGEPNASIAGAVLITVQGNFALNGTSGNEITFNGPDLAVTGTAVAHFTTATDSDASAGTKVTATDNCVDGTGNTNWLFAHHAAWYYRAQEAVAV